MPQNPGRERVLLSLLHSMEHDSTQSQRTMATEVGVALGLINTCVRYCVRKGYVKVKRIPARRYAYFLTPKGMAEKSRLTVSHLSNSLSFFRQAREDCDKVLRIAEIRGWYRIVLVGGGELAEIAILCATRRSAALVAILDTVSTNNHLRGLPVVQDLDGLPPFDAAMVTDTCDPQGTYDRLRARLDDDQILLLDVLRISARTPRGAGS